MFTIWYSNRPQRKPQLARYSIRLASALLTKRVNGSAGWRDSLRVASGGSERVKIVADALGQWDGRAPRSRAYPLAIEGRRD
jgi:hypothetical protein